MQCLLVGLCRRMRRATLEERRRNLEEADAGQHARRVGKAASSARARTRLIRSLLRYEGVPVFVTPAEWQAWKEEVGVLPLRVRVIHPRVHTA